MRTIFSVAARLSICAVIVLGLLIVTPRAQARHIQLAITVSADQTSLLTVQPGQMASLAIKDGPTFGFVATVEDHQRAIVRVVVSQLRDAEMEEVTQLELRVGDPAATAATIPAILIGVRSIS